MEKRLKPFGICLLLLGCATAFAQSEWRFGNYAALGFTREWNVALMNPLGTNANSLILPEWEYPRTGASYSIGFSAYRRSKHRRNLFFETGIAFTRRQYTRYELRVSTGLPTPIANISTLRIQMSIIQIPLLLQWRLTNNPNWRPIITGGMIPGAIMRYVSTDENNRTIAWSSQQRRGMGGISLGLYLSAGVYHQINERYALLAEPSFLLDIPANDRTFALKITLIHDFFSRKN